jgi:hypothetical protein
MRDIQPKIPNRYVSSNEPNLYIRDFMGIDLDTPHNALPPGWFRKLENLDLYKNSGPRTRRGWKVSNASANYSGTVLNLVVWDIGSDDIAIFSLRSSEDSKVRFYYKNLTTSGNFGPVVIKGTGSGAQLELTLTEPPDMFVLNKRIYVFTLAGNYIIEYNEGDTNLFTTRTMGLTAPTIESVALGAGDMVGQYAMGVELVYQKDGIDLAASTPNRIRSDGRVTMVYVDLNNVTLTLDDATLPSGGGGDDYYTHVRVYQSRRLDRDTTDPNNPIGPFGPEDGTELYPVAIISKADLITASYQIVINVNDADMDTTEVWEYDRIELTPLPASYTGTVHKGRIYVAGCSTVDPTESIIYYSNFSGTKYSEQSNPLQNIPVNSGDGKKIRKMLSLNNDLVIFKETSTFVAQNGNVDLPPVEIDKSIGLSSHRLANYIPKLGLVGLTSDNFQVKIFTDQLQWTNAYGKMEISRQVAPKTRLYAANPNQVSIIYINGKLMISNGGIDNVSEYLCLHHEQQKGWTTGTYPVATSQFYFTYANGSRAGIITGGQVQMEIELFDTYVDSPAVNPFPIPVSISTHMFQNNLGNDLLEFHNLLISGTLEDTALTGTAMVNEIPWLTIEDTEFKPNPNSLMSTQKSGLYQLFLSKRPAYPFMYFDLATAGDVTFNFIKWNGIINTDLALNYLNKIKMPALPEILVQPQDVEV